MFACSLVAGTSIWIALDWLCFGCISKNRHWGKLLQIASFASQTAHAGLKLNSASTIRANSLTWAVYSLSVTVFFCMFTQPPAGASALSSRQTINWQSILVSLLRHPLHCLIHRCIEKHQHQLQQSSIAIITSYRSNGLLVLVVRVMVLNSACSMSAFEVLSFCCGRHCSSMQTN